MAISRRNAGPAGAMLRLIRDGHGEVSRSDELSKSELLDRASQAIESVLGYVPHLEQLLAAEALSDGSVIDMKTGEGKTLAAVLAAYLHHAAGRRVHIVVPNDYLAMSQADEMSQPYESLGMTVAVVRPGMTMEQRRQAYEAHVVYATLAELGFDHMRDHMVSDPEYQVRSADEQIAVILDEIDSTLLDQGRTPLVISAPSSIDSERVRSMSDMVSEMVAGVHYTVHRRDRAVGLTERGIDWLEDRLGLDNLYAPDNGHTLMEIMDILRAHELYVSGVDYVVSDGHIVPIDPDNGRPMFGRRFDGVHTALEAREGLEVRPESIMMARLAMLMYISANYSHVSGMSATAHVCRREFGWYGLSTERIPTHEQSRRIDHEMVVYGTHDAKDTAIVSDVLAAIDRGRPVLVIAADTNHAESISAMLERQGVEHDLLTARDHASEADIVARAGRSGRVTVSTSMAGRGTDIRLDQVARQSGGLHVIVGDVMPRREIDQARGRSGRQGDPGSTVVYASLEDDLAVRYIDPWVRVAFVSAATDDEALSSSAIRRHIDRITTMVEADRASQRLALIRYDRIVELQRRAYQGDRQRLLHEIADRAIREDVLRLVDAMWREHLLRIDDLRRGIGMVAYGGRDPWVEFVDQVSAMYDSMIEELSPRVRAALLADRKGRRLESSAESGTVLPEAA